MKKLAKCLICLSCAIIAMSISATNAAETAPALHGITHRTPQLNNGEVATWETVIYPGKGQALALHQHNKGRVLVALTDGVIKLANKDGTGQIIHLKAGQSYYLPADDLHTDENMGTQPIRVVVIQLK